MRVKSSQRKFNGNLFYLHSEGIMYKQEAIKLRNFLKSCGDTVRMIKDSAGNYSIYVLEEE